MNASDLNRILRHQNAVEPAVAREAEWLATAAALAAYVRGGDDAMLLEAREAALAEFGLCSPPPTDQLMNLQAGRRALAGESGEVEDAIRSVLFPLPL
ncbi:MAG: hypothetical protein K1X67_03380 [Fimbriimonadaceae bacterium]|nr:hypothetical protein [Fimbriimonadaceae bacterium]